MARDMVKRADVTFDHYHEVLAGPLHGVSRFQQVISLLKILVGVVQSLVLVLRRRPHVLFLTGGWVGFPVALACWLARRPIVIYVPDIEPGLALRLLGRYFARVIAATLAGTAQFFPGKRVVETGYPLRRDLIQATREAGQHEFGLDPARPTLLVWGGSRGARGINTLVGQIVPDLLADGLQVIHISGTLDWPQVEARHGALAPAQQVSYKIYPFRSDIGLAFAAADLVISRAGASTLAEYPQHSLPAILVPYPYAWRYQKVNADYLVGHGAAVRLDEERLHDELLPTIRALFAEPGRLAAMRTAAGALRQAEGAAAIARLVAEMALAQ